MDKTLVQIREACNLAKDLEVELAALQNHPEDLLRSCMKVTGAFNEAIHSLTTQSSYFSPLAMSEALLFRDEGTSHGGSRMPVENILHSGALAEGDNPFFSPGLGPEIRMPESMVAVTTEIPGAQGYTVVPQTEVEPFRGSRTEAEGPSGLGRRPAGSSSQRSSRRRDRVNERVTYRVPAHRTGNTDLPPDDGYTWRKYGQKNILGSRFPRSYYRCTHRNFYGCEAKKRLQRLDDDPYTYEVTYCGTHTCHTSTAPLLMPSLPLPTTISTITTTTTNPVEFITVGVPNTGNPEEPTAALALAEPMMITNQTSPLSTSIRLGSWLTRGVEGGGSSHAGTSHTQGGGSRDAECPVTDLADAMFNPGSSGSSIDAIFTSTRKDN